MLETRKLLKECGYDRAIISSRSNEITLISSDGTKYEIIDKDDVYDCDDDVSANEDEDDSYYYEVDDDSDAEEGEEGVEESEAEEEISRRKNTKRGAKIIEGEEEESEEEKNNEKQMPDSAIKMGQDLFTLRQHINKLPSPPPTNNCNILENEEDYRKALINHLRSINSVDDFTNLNIFVPITPSPSSSRKRSLSFILNEEEKNDNDNEPSRKRALSYILNEGDDSQKMDEDDDGSR